MIKSGILAALGAIILTSCGTTAPHRALPQGDLAINGYGGMIVAQSRNIGSAAIGVAYGLDTCITTYADINAVSLANSSLLLQAGTVSPVVHQQGMIPSVNAGIHVAGSTIASSTTADLYGGIHANLSWEVQNRTHVVVGSYAMFSTTSVPIFAPFMAVDLPLHRSLDISIHAGLLGTFNRPLYATRSELGYPVLGCCVRYSLIGGI